MTEQGAPSGRRRKWFLSPSQKYEIWVGFLRGESTISGAADRVGVDRSTVIKLRHVAKQGALEALAASRPGVKAAGVDWLGRDRSLASQARAPRLMRAAGVGVAGDRSACSGCKLALGWLNAGTIARHDWTRLSESVRDRYPQCPSGKAWAPSRSACLVVI